MIFGGTKLRVRQTDQVATCRKLSE